MTTLTVRDNEILYFQNATGLSTTNYDDLIRSYFSNRSGLTPAARYSLNDHKQKFYRDRLGVTTGTIDELEAQYWRAITGLTTEEYDDLRYAYFSSASAAPRFSDPFTRANGAIGAPWVDQIGTWEVETNKARVSAVDAAGLAVTVPDEIVASVSVDVTLSATNNRAVGGLTVRFADINNFILIALIKVGAGSVFGGVFTGLQVYKAIGGVPSLIESEAAVLANGGTYKLQSNTVGKSIAIFLDGNLITQYNFSDPEHAALGDNHGLYTFKGAADDDGGTRWDNFKIQVP